MVSLKRDANGDLKVSTIHRYGFLCQRHLHFCGHLDDYSSDEEDDLQ